MNAGGKKIACFRAVKLRFEGFRFYSVRSDTRNLGPNCSVFLGFCFVPYKRFTAFVVLRYALDFPFGRRVVFVDDFIDSDGCSRKMLPHSRGFFVMFCDVCYDRYFVVVWYKIYYFSLISIECIVTVKKSDGLLPSMGL